jgi:hypothetical protein
MCLLHSCVRATYLANVSLLHLITNHNWCRTLYTAAWIILPVNSVHFSYFTLLLIVGNVLSPLILNNLQRPFSVPCASRVSEQRPEPTFLLVAKRWVRDPVQILHCSILVHCVEASGTLALHITRSTDQIVHLKMAR